MSETVHIPVPEAVTLLQSVFVKAGAPAGAALSVATALVAAEAEGQGGHGFARVADYVAQARSGKIQADATPAVTQRGLSSVYVDAGLGFAYPALDAGLEAGLPLAHRNGIAVIAVGNSHHCGALSVQVDKIAAQGLIAIMVANTPKAMAPWGAAQAVFGTNPIAFATPRLNAPPLVIDLSLSRVARGKVMAAKQAGGQIPEGWALDAEGRPTTCPEAALSGTMVPAGEAKGTALALMVELLAAAFSGSAFSGEAGSFFHADGAPPRVGQTIIAIDPAGQGDYMARASELLDGIAALEGARLPGDRRRAALAQAATEGLQVPAPLFEAVEALA